MPQEAEGSGAEFDDDTGENGWEGTKEGVGHKRGFGILGRVWVRKGKGGWYWGCEDHALNWFSFVHCLV